MCWAEPAKLEPAASALETCRPRSACYTGTTQGAQHFLGRPAPGDGVSVVPGRSWALDSTDLEESLAVSPRWPCDLGQTVSCSDWGYWSTNQNVRVDLAPGIFPRDGRFLSPCCWPSIPIFLSGGLPAHHHWLLPLVWLIFRGKGRAGCHSFYFILFYLFDRVLLCSPTWSAVV